MERKKYENQIGYFTELVERVSFYSDWFLFFSAPRKSAGRPHCYENCAMLVLVAKPKSFQLKKSQNNTHDHVFFLRYGAASSVFVVFSATQALEAYHGWHMLPPQYFFSV